MPRSNLVKVPLSIADAKKKLSTRIKVLLIENDMGQQELADIYGMSQANVSKKISKSNFSMTLAEFMVLADRLKIPPEDLIKVVKL